MSPRDAGPGRSPSFESDVRAALAPHLPQVLAAVQPAAGGARVTPPLGELADQLARFCAELAAANERINLTGISDAEGMALRHALDSLTVVPLLAGCRSLMDFGSGGGLPGVPIALARPDLAVTLVESRERKAAALAELVQRVGLSPRVAVAHARGEAWLAAHTVDAVVARAVSETSEMLESLRPVRGRFRRLILMKGPAADDELLTAASRLQRLGFAPPERHEARLPAGAGQRVLLVFAGAAPSRP